MAVALVCFRTGLWTVQAQDRNAPTVRPPLDARQAAELFQVQHGYRVELVASEPDVVDPVAIAFDERGWLWVVEMGDYPTAKQGESRIKILHDPDRDGRYTVRSVFARGLRFAHGILPWKDGAFVTMAPYILFFRDADGDGVADHREVWYRGFAEQNPQLRVNHPTFALDNWIYAANGLRGGDVVDARRPNAPVVSLRARDFRFDPLSGQYEAVAGNGQFGLTFDAWGHRFICSNRNHIKQVVLELRYLRRFPYVPFTVTDVDIPDHGAASQLFTISGNWTTSNLHRGTFTAACGICVYVGDRMPGLYGNSFTCDPTANVVHRDVLVGDGPAYVARRAPEDAEFLASPDDWFRPVNLANGPDGALYVIDMYRAVIEHPEFMPPELRERPDLYDGNDRGRIWRIVPERAGARTGDHSLPLRPEEAPTALASPNGWWRRQAQRLIVQDQRTDMEEQVRRIAQTAALGEARVQALWTLAGIDRLTVADVRRALEDPHPRVRENALRLVELARAPSELKTAVLALMRDPVPAVVFQATLTAGEYADIPTEAYADVLLRYPTDQWMRLAVACSAADRSAELLRRVMKATANSEEQDDRLDLAEFLGELIASKNQPREVSDTLAWLNRGSASVPELVACLSGLARGLERRRTTLAAYFAAPSGRPLATRVLDAARQSLATPAIEDGLAERLIELLAYVPGQEAETLLRRTASTESVPVELRIVAVQSLGRRGDRGLPDLLFERWRRLTLRERRAALEVLLRRADYASALLEAMEKGTVPPGEVGTTRLEQLRRSLPQDSRLRLDKILQRYRPADRQEVIERYRRALSVQPDFARGRRLFEEKCATCHRVANIGNDVGPDISDTRTRSPESLLVDILDPNRAIDANYVNYVVITRDGRVYTGIIASETDTAITLVRGANERDTVLKEDIEEVISSGKSLMPEGFEQELTIQDIADIIGYLKNWRYIERDKEPAAPPVPGVNTPPQDQTRDG